PLRGEENSAKARNTSSLTDSPTNSHTMPATPPPTPASPSAGRFSRREATTLMGADLVVQRNRKRRRARARDGATPRSLSQPDRPRTARGRIRRPESRTSAVEARCRIGDVAQPSSTASRADDLAHELQVEIITG